MKCYNIKKKKKSNVFENIILILVKFNRRYRLDAKINNSVLCDLRSYLLFSYNWNSVLRFI